MDQTTQQTQQPAPVQQTTESVATVPKARVILDQAIAFYKTNWKLIWEVAGITYIVSVLTEVISTLLNPMVAIPLIIVSSVISYVSGIAFIHIISKNGISDGGAMGAYKAGFAFLLPYIWINALAGITIFGGIALLIIPGIFISLSLIFVYFAYIVDGKHGSEALIQSAYYTKDRLLDVFGKGVYLGIVTILISLLAVIPYLILGKGMALSLIMSFLNYFIIVPISLFFTYYLYQAYKSSRPTSPTPEEIRSIRTKLNIFTVIGALVMIAITAGSIYIFSQVLLRYPNSTEYLKPRSGIIENIKLPSAVGLTGIFDYLRLK